MSDVAYGKPATRPMHMMRKKPSVQELMNHRTGYLTDYSANHEVRLDWKLNKEAQRDHIFKLTIDEKEVIIDLEELLYYTRIMF